MSDTSITFLRLSVSLFMFAAKGNQGGIVQRQIEAMGLREWLSLVAVWLVKRVCTEIARIRGFVAPLPPTLGLKPATAKIAVPTPIYLF
jgi:hypothetical protein